MRQLQSLILVGAGGTTATVVGAIGHDQVLNWTGVIIAVASTLITAGIAAYHRIRDARRKEDASDRQAWMDDIRAICRVQIELEQRVQTTEAKLREVEAHMEKVRCRFPNPDGTAKCTALDKPNV